MASPFCTKTTVFRTAGYSSRACIFPRPRSLQSFTTSRPREQLRIRQTTVLPHVARSTLPRANPLKRRSGTRHEATSASSSATAKTTSEDVLTWDRFFNLRRRRRFINLGASITCAVSAVAFTVPQIAKSDLDKTISQTLGAQLDPYVVLCLTTVAVAAGGWLCGPTFGSAAFRTWAKRKGWSTAVTEKEKSFYTRIKRYRADPSSSSPQNPIPDYYGEKIASVKDYRRWLKDQRTFARKATKNML